MLLNIQEHNGLEGKQLQPFKICELQADSCVRVVVHSELKVTRK